MAEIKEPLGRIISKVGSVVRCIDKSGRIYEGEVMAFDCFSKLAILKSMSSENNNYRTSSKINNSKANCSDYILLNLNQQKDILLLKEAPPDSSSFSSNFPELDMEKLSNRVLNNSEEKVRKVNLNKDHYEYAVALVSKLRRSINEVKWINDEIVVMEVVFIKPPYLPENCCLPNLQKEDALQLVTKMVSNFHNSWKNPKNNSFNNNNITNNINNNINTNNNNINDNFNNNSSNSNNKTAYNSNGHEGPASPHSSLQLK